MKNKILKLINLNNLIKRTINDPEIYPSKKHSIIFSNKVNGEIKKIVKSLNLTLKNDYLNNYEDDMERYAYNVNNLVEQLEPLVSEIHHENPSVQILKSLLKDVKTVINSELEWEIKYNIVFSETLSGKIYKELENIDVKFDYYDPDTDYEDDVRAFANGLNNFLEENFK